MGEQWSTTQEEEELYRKQLFRKAKRGDAKARRELHETYAVRIWSEQERAGLVYENPKFKPERVGKKR
jgi:hypothetical protein